MMIKFNLTCYDDVWDVSLPSEHLQAAHRLLVPHDLVQFHGPVLLHPGQLVRAPGALGRRFGDLGVPLLLAPSVYIHHLGVHVVCQRAN